MAVAASAVGCVFPLAGALRLIRKTQKEQSPVPANMATALLRTLWKRKKLNPLAFAAQIGRSQRDRYLAAKKAKRESTQHGR